MAEVSSAGDKLLAAGVAPGVPIFYSDRKVQTAKISDVYLRAVLGGRFFAVTREPILKDIEKTYPTVALETYYKGLGYALYGRR